MDEVGCEPPPELEVEPELDVDELEAVEPEAEELDVDEPDVEEPDEEADWGADVETLSAAMLA